MRDCRFGHRDLMLAAHSVIMHGYANASMIIRAIESKKPFLLALIDLLENSKTVARRHSGGGSVKFNEPVDTCIRRIVIEGRAERILHEVNFT